MRIRFSTIVAWCQYSLFIAGLSALGYCAVVIGTATYFQVRAREQLRKSDLRLSSVSPAGSFAPAPLREGPGFALVGRVNVPRVHLSAMVAEGSTKRILRVAVGHVAGTALPGQSGNVALVGHRDTFFRHLAEVRTGDIITLTVPGQEYTYHVTFTDVVKPEETWVLQPATGETLTLITCYPFRFVGPAPQRFVVRARRSDLMSGSIGE